MVLSKDFMPKITIIRVAEWSKANVLETRLCRFETRKQHRGFYYFFQFYQTLRAYISFARNFAILGPFPCNSNCFNELLNLSSFACSCLLNIIFFYIKWVKISHFFIDFPP